MKSKILGFTAVLLALCMMTGCFVKPKNRNAMDRIKGDIECEFRVGKDAKTQRNAIDTDVVFDKDITLLGLYCIAHKVWKKNWKLPNLNIPSASMRKQLLGWMNV